jgi:YD repeat-containing protein
MKTNLPLWVLMLCNTFLLAQPKLIQEDYYKLDSITREETKARQITYAYDEAGRVIEKIEKHWIDDERWEVISIDEFAFNENGDPTLVSHLIPADTMQDFFTSSFRYETEYDEKNRKTKEFSLFFNPVIDDWVFLQIYTWRYNENDCLTEKERIKFSPIFGGQTLELEEFYYSNSCQADSSLVQVISTGIPEWRMWQKKRYSYDETENANSTEIYAWDTDMENWVLDRVTLEKLDEKGRWLEHDILFANTGKIDRFVRSFDEQDQLVYSAILSRAPGQTEFQTESETITAYDEAGQVTSIKRTHDGELYQEINYDYRYDINGFLTRQDYRSIIYYHQTNYIEETTQKFENYCDGLARKSELSQFYSNLGTQEYLIDYIYDEGINCEAAPTHEPIIVYPNPTPDGIVHIQSEFLLYAPIQYLVFDNLGRQLLSGELTERVTAQTLDLSALQNGIYYLYLLHDSKNTIRKLIIQKN